MPGHEASFVLETFRANFKNRLINFNKKEVYLFNKLHSELSETVDSKDSHLLILITPHFVKVLTYHMPDLTPLKPQMWWLVAVSGG